MLFLSSGLIGQSWAMIFASAGYQVFVYDIEESQIKNSLTNIKQQFETLEKDGVLRGTLSATQQYECIRGKYLFVVIFTKTIKESSELILNIFLVKFFNLQENLKIICFNTHLIV